MPQTVDEVTKPFGGVHPKRGGNDDGSLANDTHRGPRQGPQCTPPTTEQQNNSPVSSPYTLAKVRLYGKDSGGGGPPTHARTSFLRTRQQVWWRRRTLGVTLCPLPLPPSLPFISLVGKIKDPHRTFDLLLQHVDLDRLGETGDSILHRLQLLRQFLLNLQQVLLRLHHIYPVPLRQLDLDTRIYAGDSVRTPLNDAVSEGGGGGGE